MKEEYTALRSEIQQDFMLQFLALGFSLTTLLTVFNLNPSIWTLFPPQLISALLLIFLCGISFLLKDLDRRTSLAATYIMVFFEEDGLDISPSKPQWETRLKRYRKDKQRRRQLRQEVKLKKGLPKIQFSKGISGIIFIEMLVCGFLPLVLARDQLPLLTEMRVKELINSQSIGWLIYLLSFLGSGIMLRMLILPPPWHEHECYWHELKNEENNKNQVVDGRNQSSTQV